MFFIELARDDTTTHEVQVESEGSDIPEGYYQKSPEHLPEPLPESVVED
jgi:hypothetical protein